MFYFILNGGLKVKKVWKVVILVIWYNSSTRFLNGRNMDRKKLSFVNEYCVVRLFIHQLMYKLINSKKSNSWRDKGKNQLQYFRYSADSRQQLKKLSIIGII